MPWLLDTCVLSEVVRKAPHEGVLAWLARHGGESWLTLVSIGEIQYGIERMPPGRPRNTLQLWFDEMCEQYQARTLPMDEPVWRTYARLKASLEAIGRPQEEFDLLIAATATVHKLTVVTRNTRHFQDAGVKMLNPWMAH